MTLLSHDSDNPTDDQPASRVLRHLRVDVPGLVRYRGRICGRVRSHPTQAGVYVGTVALRSGEVTVESSVPARISFHIATAIANAAARSGRVVTPVPLVPAPEKPREVLVPVITRDHLGGCRPGRASLTLQDGTERRQCIVAVATGDHLLPLDSGLLFRLTMSPMPVELTSPTGRGGTLMLPRDALARGLDQLVPGFVPEAVPR